MERRGLELEEDEQRLRPPTAGTLLDRVEQKLAAATCEEAAERHVTLTRTDLQVVSSRLAGRTLVTLATRHVGAVHVREPVDVRTAERCCRRKEGRRCGQQQLLLEDVRSTQADGSRAHDLNAHRVHRLVDLVGRLCGPVGWLKPWPCSMALLDA
eukprot:scaffold64575_cov68-Phaeocystis_antarctica.AAC.3